MSADELWEPVVFVHFRQLESLAKGLTFSTVQNNLKSLPLADSAASISYGSSDCESRLKSRKGPV